MGETPFDSLRGVLYDGTCTSVLLLCQNTNVRRKNSNKNIKKQETKTVDAVSSRRRSGQPEISRNIQEESLNNKNKEISGRL